MTKKIVFLLCLALVTTGLFAQDEQVEPKILMLVGEGFNGNEFWEPYFAFTSIGYRVDVAAPSTGPVSCGNDKQGRLDWHSEMTLAEVNVEEYTGFFLPGGKGPENLEKHEEAISIVRSFFDMDKPVTTLCHGPRLLGKAGVMEGRVVTYLFRVRDEIPEEFKSGKLGYYADMPLVKDGNFITGRFPGDVTGLIIESLNVFEENGGLEVPETWPSILLVDGGISKKERYGYTMGGLKSQADVKVIRPAGIEKFITGDDYDPDHYDILVILDGEDGGEIDGTAAFQKLVGDFRNRQIASTKAARKSIKNRQIKRGMVILSGSTEENMADIMGVAHESSDRTKKPEEDLPDAFLAIEEDFDEVTYLTLRTLLEMDGYEVLTISSKKGNVRSMNGIYAYAGVEYREINPGSGLLVADPGGLWPDHDPLTPAEQEHFDWLIGQFNAGAMVVSVGFGSYHLGVNEEFRGMKIASSDQVMWSFNKKPGGKYTPEPAFLSAPNLITIKSSGHLAEGMKLLKENL